MSDTENTNTLPTITEAEMNHNPLLSMVIEKDSELKDYFVQYVGTKMDKEEVTVQMLAETLALEFPEFMYAMAEENYLLGYKQGLEDATRLPEESSSSTE